MGLPLYQIDAFADRPFMGNPAAVCLLDGPLDDAWMLAVAAEMNVSETAFLLPEAEIWGLRWFTPVAEVDLCGHGTLAAAHALWESGRAGDEPTLRFRTRSGLLCAERAAEPTGAWITLDFPATPAEPAPEPAGMAAALGVRARWIGRSAFDYLAELDDVAAVRSLRPDLAAIATWPARGLIVTALADAPPHDFVSRFFAPAIGVAEDPVTGSAHCCLGPFWAARLGRTRLLAHQASRRGGTLRVETAGNRIRLSGQAVTVLRGELA